MGRCSGSIGPPSCLQLCKGRMLGRRKLCDRGRFFLFLGRTSILQCVIFVVCFSCDRSSSTSTATWRGHEPCNGHCRNIYQDSLARSSRTYPGKSASTGHRRSRRSAVILQSNCRLVPSMMSSYHGEMLYISCDSAGLLPKLTKWRSSGCTSSSSGLKALLSLM